MEPVKLKAKQTLKYFIAIKDDEKHMIRYYDDDVAEVARQLHALAVSKEYKFDHMDCIRSIIKLCKEHQKEG